MSLLHPLALWPFRTSASGLLAFAVLLFVLSLASAQDKGLADFPKLNAAADWPWWRGPSRNGIAAPQKVPAKLTEAGAAWKVPVPGRGHASPTVVGDRIFLATADEKEKVQSVVA